MLPSEQFPMFKLLTLLARQMSSPIATRIKRYAMEHPGVGREACVSVARAYRNADLRFKMWTLRLPSPKRMPTFSEAEALQIGGDIIGELIIFSLGASIIIFEVNRQAAKTEFKQLVRESEWVALKIQLDEFQHELQLQQAEIDRLRTALAELTSIS